MNGGVWPALQPIGCRSAPKLEIHFQRREAARSIKPGHGGTVLARPFSTSALTKQPDSQSPRRLDHALDAVRVQHRSPPARPQPSDQPGAIGLSVEAVVTMAQRRIRRMELELRGLHRVASGIEPPQAARRTEHLRVLEELLGLEEELKRYQLQQWRADEELAQVQARIATMESEAAQGEAKRESLAGIVAGLQAALQRATKKEEADAAKAAAASKAQADEWARMRAHLEAELQAQADEAARVRAHLEADLAERTANASQLEQACARLVAEMLKERAACDAEKKALEATLAHERVRMEANAAEGAAALQAQVDEVTKLRMFLKVMLVLGLSIKDESEEELTGMHL